MGLSLISSGGGFSTLAGRPSYQQAVVQAYLANTSANLPPNNLFNASNRGFPDVRCGSCFAAHICVARQARVSYACPVGVESHESRH